MSTRKRSLKLTDNSEFRHLPNATSRSPNAVHIWSSKFLDFFKLCHDLSVSSCKDMSQVLLLSGENIKSHRPLDIICSVRSIIKLDVNDQKRVGLLHSSSNFY